MAAPIGGNVSKHDDASACGKLVDSLPHGDRTFYTLPEERRGPCSYQKSGVKVEKIAEVRSYIQDNVVGRDSTFYGPYGQRKVVYCDYTASGRSLEMIEDYIKTQVLPLYSNTHTTTTVTALQTTLYRHEARDIIRNAVNASEHDAVIFVGTGCTAAVHKLIHSLHLQDPPVVLVGPFEHHSNLLPWRETGAEVVRISEDEDGRVDMTCLEKALKKWSTSGRQLIGCFSAASNITGILTDDVQVTVMLHRYNALAFWDYATAGPYVDINMNPVTAVGDVPSLAYKDAVFLSPHKFVGGVETPGVLVAKKSLFRNPVPSNGGGGSVFFVTHEDHRYLKQVEMREEGGTPSIVGAVRAGLVFQLKAAVGADRIMSREHDLCRRAISRWNRCPSLVLLGNTAVPRLPIFSFLIRHPTTQQFLHHNFVCAVLNDVFGIQARGGCACAGPYAQDLLGIDKTLAKDIEAVLLEDGRLDRVHLRRYTEYSEREVLRPGFTRLNLPYFMDDACVDFVLEAISLTAQHAWKLLPQYIVNPETGEWRQRNHQVFQDRRWLGSISYSEGRMAYPDPPPARKSKGRLPTDYEDCLGLADEIFKNAEKVRVQLPDQTLLFDSKAANLRWFMLPSEALDLLGNSSRPSQHALPKQLPFEPVKYKTKTNFAGALEMSADAKQHCGGLLIGSAENNQRTDVAPDYFTNNPSGSVGSSRCVAMGSASCDSHHALSRAEQFRNTVEDGVVQTQTQRAGCNDSRVCLDQTNGVKGRTPRGEEDAVDAGKNAHCGRNDVPSVQDTGLGVMSSEGVSDHTETISEPPSMEDALAYADNQSGNGLKTDTAETKGSSSRFPAEDFGKKLSVSSTCDDTQSGVLAKPSPDDISARETSCSVVELKTSVPDDPRSLSIGHFGSSCNVGTAEALTEMPTSDEALPKPSRNKKNLSGFQKPPKGIFKPTVQALEEYRMIQDGDRVLVCLSGGKDSLSLLHTLKQYQFYAKSKGISFELGGVTVDPQTMAYDPRPLIPYLASLGVPYFYEEQRIIDAAAGLDGGCDSICSFCSRMKRGRLYACARREGYNVLAMGQHLDDLAESFLMSVFHNGLLRTMKANYAVKEGDLRVIRPLVYTREKDLRDFAEKAKLPVIPENCPACFEAPKERHRTKQLLASQELLFPRLYSSLQAAMKPLMAKNRTGMESSRKKEDFFDENDF